MSSLKVKSESKSKAPKYCFLVGCGEDGLSFYRRGETRLRLNGCGSGISTFLRWLKVDKRYTHLFKKKNKIK